MNIPEELLPVVEWWEKDGKKTLAIAAVAGVAALAVWCWKANAERQREEAAAALSGAGDAESLEEAVSKYGSQPSAPMLKLKLAAALYGRQEDGDVEKALGIYEALLADGSAPAACAGVPAVGRAECLEALERWDDAAKAYGEFISSAVTNSSLTLSARLGLARCIAQTGKKDEAVANLDTLRVEYASDKSAVARIDAAAEAVKRWTKREPPAPEAAVETPAAPETVAEPPAPETTVEAASEATPAEEPAKE